MANAKHFCFNGQTGMMEATVLECLPTYLTKLKLRVFSLTNK